MPARAVSLALELLEGLTFVYVQIRPFSRLRCAHRTDDTLRARVCTRIGYWFDNCGAFGIKPEFLLLGEANSSVLFVAPACGVIARMFVDSASGARAFEFTTEST
jgi:hypothetical protein